jgi:uncharacterized repeat protein (TIGR01451 family)
MICLCLIGDGQTVTLTVSSANATPGSAASLNLQLNTSTGTGPAAVQWTVNAPSPQVQSISATAGSSALAAAKTISCSGNTCIISGLNANPIANGTVAILNLQLAPAASGNLAIQLSNASAASLQASSIPVTTTDGVVSIPSPSVSITLSHSGSFTQGQQNAQYTVAVSNTAGAGPTSGTVTVTESVPSGLTLVSMSGTGWTCSTNTCTRGDALNGGASYPAIMVTVNVAANATSPQVNAVSVSGGGSATASTTDSTSLTANPALLTIAKSHSGSFTQGQQNAQYTVAVSNTAGAGPTSGTVTVTETVPAGLTLASMSGTGWTCVGNACTRSDALSGGVSYPAIAVTVNVNANATSPQVNAVSVSGGGAAAANASDTTTITGTNQPPVAVSVTPSSGNGSSQTFSFLLFDPNGFTEMPWVQMIFNATLNASAGCFTYYDRVGNLVYLRNDAATGWLGPVVLGTANSVQNSQCIVDALSSSASGAGNSLTVNLALSFKAAFGGAKNIYQKTQDTGGLATGWQQRGTWTPSSSSNLPSSAVSVTPSSGTGSSQTFSFLLSDPNGFTDMPWVQMIFNATLNTSAGCFTYYDRVRNLVYLQNDAATGWLGPVAFGTANSVQNSQCIVNALSSSASGVGNNLTVNLALIFKAAFTGTKNIYMQTQDTGGLVTGWQQLGTWTPSSSSNPPPSAVLVTPSSGPALSHSFAGR